ncbi:hypothetical protein FSP39_001670 [Pinctada imbricata]|uniref:Uncharacterized protein n=1 Tax=Pinctada imbricata TaxID=66713 RepID=A0AA88Y6Y9_PINIB|nr:hypothetical protein FSP39_001670 [Pinctada imbricata]
MSVVTQQPGSNAQALVAVHGSREWSTGLFGCFSDIGSCIKGYFCLPCTTCALATRLGECCCMPYCVPGGTIAMRARLRTIGGIQRGDYLHDNDDTLSPGSCLWLLPLVLASDFCIASDTVPLSLASDISHRIVLQIKMSQQTTVILQQPTSSMGNPLVACSVHGSRNWSTSLLGCFDDIMSCVKGFFCLPCAICGIASRTGECCCMPFCVQGGVVAMRARIRTIGGIQGSICNDCVTTYFCTPCVVCQMERELDAMNIK